MGATTIHNLMATAQARPAAAALVHKQGGEWEVRSWSDYWQSVRQAGRALIARGMAPGESIAILANNRPEWLIADLAALAAGGLPAGIYATLPPDQAAYIAGHCQARVAFADTDEQLAKLRAIRRDLPHLTTLVAMSDRVGGDDVLSWNAFLTLADQVPESALDQRIAALRPDQPATLIYTSGTTGPPKAVMLSHDNLAFTVETVITQFEAQPTEVLLSYLPLSHVAEQMISIHFPVALGATVYFAESLERLGDNLREVRPTIFFGVPRVWEKIQARIVEAAAKNPPWRRAVGRWARGVGLAAGYARQRGERLPLLYPLADLLVFRKVRQALGLERARLCATSAAPISRDTLEFFLSLGVTIFELYGMSECTGPTTLSLEHAFKTGAVGRPMPGTELRLAPDGEILIRGRHVFLGYHKNEAATREVLEPDGWLHSGDVGEMDGDGYLRITDRKKDLIITSGGKNVAPQNLEKLLTGIPGIGQAVVLGDRRNYLTALLTLDPQVAPAEADRLGIAAADAAALVADPAFLAHLGARIEALNRGLARYETVKRFTVLPRELTVETGELTPTLKVRRKVVNERYAAEIEAMYSGG